MEHFDAAVVGLGIHGAAAVRELARRGLRTIGLDRAAVPNPAGSSAGRTRITREAYFEHPLYVPLVQRAAELWHDLEELTGTVLLRRTGAVYAGPPDGVLIEGVLRSARQHGLEHELVDGEDLHRRVPALQPMSGHVAVLEPAAGVLMAEAGVRTLVRQAEGYGAVIRTGAEVVAWEAVGDDVVVQFPGATVRARQVLFAAGPRLNALLAARRGADPLVLPLTVERQLPHWFAPELNRQAFGPGALPVTLLEFDPGRFLYTLPDLGHGIKAGLHHEGRTVGPEGVDTMITLAEETALRSRVEAWLPGATERLLDAQVCLYTNTPDGHFIIDRHPGHDNVHIVSACSGHGFKFGPAIGEAVADRMVEGATWFDTAPFALGRFG